MTGNVQPAHARGQIGEVLAFGRRANDRLGVGQLRNVPGLGLGKAQCRRAGAIVAERNIDITASLPLEAGAQHGCARGIS